MLISLSANKLVTFDNIPTSEKSNNPCILKAFQPSSLLITFEGTFSVGQTKYSSSSVFPRKKNSPFKSIADISFNLHTEKLHSIFFIFIGAYLKTLFQVVELMKKYIEDILILSGLALIVFPTFQLSVTAVLYAAGACLLGLGVWAAVRCGG